MLCPICASDRFSKGMFVKDHSISKESFNLGICDQCGLIVTMSPPDANAIGKYYKDEAYISHSDVKSSLLDHLYHRVRSHMLKRKGAWVEKYTNKKKGTLLDIGSGTGYFAGHMAGRGWNVQGVEVDRNARQKAQQKFGLTVHDQEHIDQLPEKAYDAVTLWHVLEHVTDLHHYLSQIHFALRPEGRCIIAVPNHKSADARHYKEYWAAYDVPRHLWHFDAVSMKNLVQNSGFVLERMLPMPMDAFYVSMLSEKYKRNRFGFVRGLWQGLISNIRALGRPDLSSSVIYVMRKQECDV